MLSVSQLFIYPIKSLGGISVSSASITNTGFEYDRRWMLVDDNLRFLTQRELPAMALLQAELTTEGIKVFRKEKVECFVLIPYVTKFIETVTVQIFEEKAQAVFVSPEADEWFSEMLNVKCRLVYMPDSARRYVDSRYAFGHEITAFSDGFPFLIIGQSSLDDLNKKLDEPLPINRFRPNIVFTGGEPFEEDRMAHFIINDVNFYGVKLCGRCVVTTINQDNANQSKEPLKTLATYRQKNNKIYFGQNLLSKGNGVIHVDDPIKIIKVSNSDDFMVS